MELHRQVRLNNVEEQQKVSNKLIPKLNLDGDLLSQKNALAYGFKFSQSIDMVKPSVSNRTYQVASDNHYEERKINLALSNFNNNDLNLTNDMQKSARNYD